MKRAISILLALITVLSAAACSKNTGAAENTTEESSAQVIETSVYDTLPKGNYSGYEFNALQYVYNHIDDMTKYHLTIDEMTGETVTDAIYEVSRSVEDSLNIVLKTDVRGLDTEVNDTITNQVLAGDDIYDVYFPYGVSNILNGYALKLNKINVFDFDKPWWNKTAMEGISLTPDYFRAYGNLSIQIYSYYEILVFNEKMRADYHIENLYDTVRNGSWTLDKLKEVSKIVATDVNGDGKMNAEDNDIFGLSTFSALGSQVQLLCSGNDLFAFDNNHNVYYKGPDERFISAFEKINKMYSDNTMYYSSKLTSSTSNFDIMKENGLFIALGHILELEAIREMESDYGVLPITKFDENQSEYITYMYNDCTPAEIPITSGDPERTATVLENLSAATYLNVKDKYIEDMLTQKLVRDQESIEMLNLIYSSKTKTDIALVYNWEDIFGKLGGLVISSSANLASTLEKLRQPLEDDVRSAIEVLNALEH